MRSILKYICLSALLCICCSCDLEEFEPHTPSKVTIDFIARPADYSNLDVTTKSEHTDDFETAIYTAYLLLFDASGNRIYFSDVDPESRLQRVTLKGLSTVTACFIANVNKADVEGITTIDGLNSVVLDIKYASYSEAHNHLGVPKLTVSDKSYPCFPMIGIKSMDDVSQMTNIEIPLTRLFAKISVNIKMQLTNIGIGQISPTLVNYELDQYQLHNLPTKVSLIKNNDNDSAWKNDPDAFTGKSDLDPVSSPNKLRLQTININDQDNNPSNNSGNVPGIGFYLYVPEYYLSPKVTITDNQKSKPVNYDSSNYAIYLELIGEVNQGLIDNTGIRHRIYLGGDNTKDFTLKRNVNYINQITITGITKNDTGTGEDLDHRVSSEIINNPVAQAGQSANCYIIGKTGEYTIPTYKGAYSTLTSAELCLANKTVVATQVNVAYNKSQTTGISTIPFKVNPEYDRETNTISFTIDQVDGSILGSLDFVPNGNFILELQYKESETGPWITEWSWHFWCLTDINILNTGWGSVGEQKMPDGTHFMLDRNIGVVSGIYIGAQSGFYFKNGDHTPYLDTNNDKTYEKLGGGSLSNNSWALINGAKSPNDPCPPGYRIPSGDMWSGKNNNNATKEHSSIVVNAFKYYETNGGTQYDLTDDYTIYYPYAGWLDEQLKLSTGVADNSGKEQTYKSTIEVKYNYSSLGVNIFSRVSSPTRFRNIQWQQVDETSEGRLWMNAGNAIRYGYIYDGIQINSLEKSTGEWNRLKTKVTWKDDWNTIKDLSSLSDTEKTTIIDNLDGNIFDKIDWNDISGSLQKIFSPATIVFEESTESSNGYQVRCVKE